MIRGLAEGFQKNVGRKVRCALGGAVCGAFHPTYDMTTEEIASSGIDLLRNRNNRRRGIGDRFRGVFRGPARGVFFAILSRLWPKDTA